MVIIELNAPNNIFDEFLDVRKQGTTPSPPSNDYIRIFADSSNELFLEKSNGDIVSLTAANITYSNAGLAGVGIILTKTANDFPFKAINGGLSATITVTDDATDKTIDLDVVDASTSQKGAVLLGTNAHSSAGRVVQTNDSRLTDSRVPTAHNTTHQSGGSDAIKLDDLAAPDDNTDLNSSITKHGLLKKLPNDSTLYIDGTGNWTAPAGGGGGGGSGETNTASNQGAAGVGVFIQKTGVDLEFKNINAGSNKVTITDDSGNDEIDIDVAQANMDISAMTGSIGNARITDLAYSKLTAVPDATTSVKGVVELATSAETTAGLAVQASDTRLSDARTPTAHKNVHKSGGSDAFIKGDDLIAAARYLEDVADPTSDAQRVWIEDDTANLKYWSDEAVPVKHIVEVQENKGAASGYASLNSSTKVPIAELPDATTSAKGISELATSAETTAGLVVQASDTRLSDARTPTAHATSHSSGGGDPVTLSNLAGSITVGQLPTDALTTTNTKTATNKTVVLTDNTITDTSAAAGDLAKHNGTKFLKFGKGAALQLLRTNVGGTDLEWVDPDVSAESVISKGNSIQSGDAADKTFTITHGLGSTPASAVVVPTSVDAFGDYITEVDGTNITITYQVAPPAGSNNLTYFWIAAATTGGVLGVGEANTVSNVGAGSGVFKQKTLFDFEFKSIVAGTDISVTGNTSDVTIAAGANVLNTTNSKTVSGKAMTLTDNTFTDASRATGDIPKDNGTKYVRLPRGSADQFLKVNSAGTDVGYEALSVALDAQALTTSNSKTVINKSMTLTDNVFTDASRATGDIPKDNGTKYVRLARGTANQFLKVNTGGTDVGYEALDVTLDATALTTTNTKTETNKTMVLASNTITDTSAATGDLPKHNGTRFVRMGMGTANQFLKVNTGATDIAYEALDVTLDANALTTTNTKTVSNKTYTAPTINSATMSGTVTIPQTGAVATTPLVFSKSDTPDTGADHVVKFMIDADVNSFLTVQNQSSSAGTFLPTLRFTQGTTSVAALIIGAGTTDTGTSPLITLDARTAADAAITTRPLVRIATNGTVKVNFNPTNVTLSDAYDFAVGSTTGTKIGTASTQKIGFFGVTPVVQPAANADTSGATLPNLEIEVNQIKALLRSLGLLA